MEPTPDSPPPSYRTRNRVLAVAALVMITAAVVRLSQTAKEEAPAEATPAATTPAPATATGTIGVEVAFAGAAPALPDTAKVYVFIRPVGERMPLAVQTYAPKDLPVVVEFSNPADTAAGKSVEAVARLSLTGAVTLQRGDSEVVSAPAQFGANGTHLRVVLGAPPANASAPATTAASGTRVSVHLALGAGIDLPPATTVFLVVRESGGSPMPLAVKRLTVADLPIDIVLTDADAMMPGRTLSGTGDVEIVARASRTGDVKAAPGDFEVRSGVLHSAAIDPNTPIQLVIADPV